MHVHVFGEVIEANLTHLWDAFFHFPGKYIFIDYV